MVYETLLLIGTLGILAQLALGFLHGNGDSHGQHGHSHDHGHGHGHNHAHGDVHHGTTHHHGHHAAHTDPTTFAEAAHGSLRGGGRMTAGGRGVGRGRSGQRFSLLSLLSPLTLFSLALGAGATGILLRSTLTTPWLLGLVAALGGLAFYGLIIQPVMNAILRFASEPAKNLGGVVAQEVEVLGKFDEAGRGMVKAQVDGQVVRLLAYLDPDVRKDGLTVIPGERLVVTEVDPKKNTVRVTRL